jgi:N-acyl-L-homoserine lactone synthetase
MGFHVIDKENRRMYANILEQYHKARHRYFVERPVDPWLYLKSPLNLDVDQYDSHNACWLNVIDEKQKFLAGGRLTSWKYPNFTAQYYDSYVKYGTLPYNQDDYVDFTRAYAPIVKGGQFNRRQAMMIFWYGLLSYFEEKGIVGYTGVIEQSMYSLQANLPMKVKILSDPISFDEGICYVIKVTPKPDAKEIIMDTAHRFGVDLKDFKIKRDLEDLPNIKSNFVPEFVHILNQASRMNLRDAKTIQQIYDHFMSDNADISEAARHELDIIMNEVTKIGFVGKLPALHQDGVQVSIN